MLLLFLNMTEQEVPFYGPSEQWYHELVAFSANYFDAIRLQHAGISEAARPKTIAEAGKKPEYSVLPAELIEILETCRTPEEIFALLNARISPEGAATFAEGKLADVVQVASRFGQEMQPLILMAMLHSVYETIPSLVWMGTRIGKVMTEYVQALEDIYSAAKGSFVNEEQLEQAQLHRDEIEYFCFHQFGRELLQLRTYLARLAPEHFLYRWEELDAKRQIVLKKFSSPKPLKKKA